MCSLLLPSSLFTALGVGLLLLEVVISSLPHTHIRKWITNSAYPDSNNGKWKGAQDGTQMFADALSIFVVLISCAVTTACLISWVPITHVDSKNLVPLHTTCNILKNTKKN
jgi:hypothetical protein